MTELATSAVAPKPRPRRTVVKSAASPSARWHASKAAVDEQGLATLFRWDEARCMREFARLRWGSHTFMPCPHCGTIDEHTWTKARENWRCCNTVCRKFFSVTTNTLFEGRRRDLHDILLETYLWSCGASGIPAMTVRMMVGTVSYNTTYSTLQKLREGLVRGHNTGLIAGVVEIDGAHASGHDSAGRRGKPLGQQQPRTKEEHAAKAQSVVDAFNAKQARAQAKKAPPIATSGAAAGGEEVVRDPNTGAALPRSRRMVVTLRRRSGNPEMGAHLTRIGVGLAETPEVVEALADRFVLMPESLLATDEGVAFKPLGRKFRDHVKVNHSERLVGPGGEHVNLAESFTARQDRAEAGIYMNIEPKYLHEYACETAFREDHRRLSARVKMAKLMFWSLNVGKSEYWTGYTHGNNREFEMLVPRRRSVGPSSGPRRREPGKEMEVRPPR
jgi:hypothetical protein